MRIGKLVALVGLVAGLALLCVVVVVLFVRPKLVANPDGTRTGDLIVFGHGWRELPSGGRLYLLRCQTRAPKMQFERADLVVFVLDIPPGVEWLPTDDVQKTSDWVYQSRVAWRVPAETGASTAVELPYKLDGRRKTFVIAGRSFDLPQGNFFVLTGEEESEPIIHQHVFDSGSDVNDMERFVDEYERLSRNGA